MDEELRHKYDLVKDCEAWEKLHGKHKYVINPPKIPKWLRSKNEKKE
jgi:hypothetical protein